MSDTAINQIIQYGTAANRALYTPDPPSSIKTLYIWYDTDSAPDTWVWDGSAWVQINASGVGGINQLTSDVTAGPGVGSQAATIANNAVTTAKINNGAVTEAKQTLADNTTWNVSTSAHGYAPKAPNDATKYLDGTGAYSVPAGSGTVSTVKLTFVFGDGVNTLAANVKARLTSPWTGTIIQSRIFSDQSGSAVVDIWKDVWANYPPTIADTITASAKPTLSSQTHVEDTTLTGWTTAVTAGDAFFGNLDSVTTCLQVVVELVVDVT